jgi:undecaprenyl-diphosphatase
VGWLDPLFEGLSWIGSSALVWLVLALALAALWRRPWIFGQVALAAGAANLSAYGLKAAIGRDRPAVAFAEPKPLVHAPHDHSFPSGHAATSFACATTLTFFAPRLAPLFFVLAAAIAWSRVYVGVHYPLDVLGGAALGAVVAIALRWLLAALRRSPRATRAG